jgi:hypothetical protein
MGIKPCPKRATWVERNRSDKFKGTVVDEVAIREDFEWGDYHKVIQMIKSDEGHKLVRFGYYWKPHGSVEKNFRWGSQNTPVLRQENARQLIEEARKRGFF